MIRIGEFSKLCGVSIKTIRFYEEKGLITPVYVDYFTGYRYYDSQNAEQLMEILFFKKLGFSLKEIRDLNTTVMMEKLSSLKKNITTIQENIKKLEWVLKDAKGEFKMKQFENDVNAVGKWRFVGSAKSKDNYLKNKLIDHLGFPFKDIYLLPNGEKYWVFSWTKGFIQIKDTMHPYEIERNHLFLRMLDYNGSSDYIVVFEKVDNKAYTIEEIRLKDKIDYEFESDPQIIGNWRSIGIVSKIEEFNPNLESQGDLWLRRRVFNSDGTIINEFVTSKLANAETWTKGFIINKYDATASHYEIKRIDGTEYLFIEWKSGDYVFGGLAPNYYVFVRG